MSKEYIFVTVFFVLLVGVGAYFILKSPEPKNDMALQTSQTFGNIVPTDTPQSSASADTQMNDKLQIQDEVVGTGAEAANGKKITVNYTGTLANGTKFDSSLNSGRTPFTFTLGAGEVIQGWDQGFAGMKVGGKRKLTIPPSLGYGSADMGAIPPNSTLIFEVELLKVE